MTDEFISVEDLKCPCGTLFLRVDGGYVPMCDCSTRNEVVVETMREYQKSLALRDV